MMSWTDWVLYYIHYILVPPSARWKCDRHDWKYYLPTNYTSRRTEIVHKLIYWMFGSILEQMEFFLNVLLNSGTKIFVITANWLEPATFCVRNQDATTAPAIHMWKTGFSNWSQFMLQWFVRFPEFAEFSESSAHLGQTPLCRYNLLLFRFNIHQLNSHTFSTGYKLWTLFRDSRTNCPCTRRRWWSVTRAQTFSQMSQGRQITPVVLRLIRG